MHGGDLHLHVDRCRAHVEGAAEDVGKAQNVVDLIGIIRASRRHDDVAAHGMRFLGRDLWIGIGHREDDRILAHRGDHVRRQRALGGQAKKDIGADHGFRQRAAVRLRRVRRFPLVHALGAALVDHALGVAQKHVVMGKPHRLDEIKAGDTGRARTVAHKPRALDVAPRELDRVQHAGGCNDRGAVLVVVEDRYVHQFLQALLDDETFRRPDIFKIDAAERGPKVTHSVDEFIRVFGVHFEID